MGTANPSKNIQIAQRKIVPANADPLRSPPDQHFQTPNPSLAPFQNQKTLHPRFPLPSKPKPIP